TPANRRRDAPRPRPADWPDRPRRTRTSAWDRDPTWGAWRGSSARETCRGGDEPPWKGSVKVSARNPGYQRDVRGSPAADAASATPPRCPGPRPRRRRDREAAAR